MNLVINYSKPALTLALRKYVSDKRFIGTYTAALYMCWARKICNAIKDLPPEALEDPAIKAARIAYESMDIDLAKRLYAWFVKCTGKRPYKLGQRIDTGEIVVLDLSKGLHDPPDWPCPEDL